MHPSLLRFVAICAKEKLLLIPTCTRPQYSNTQTDIHLNERFGFWDVNVCIHSRARTPSFERKVFGVSRDAANALSKKKPYEAARSATALRCKWGRPKERPCRRSKRFIASTGYYDQVLWRKRWQRPWSVDMNVRYAHWTIKFLWWPRTHSQGMNVLDCNKMNCSKVF